MQLQRRGVGLDPEHLVGVGGGLLAAGAPRAQPGGQFHRPHPALLQRLGPLRLVFQHLDHGRQRLLQRFQRREKRAGGGDLVRCQLDRFLRERQAQVARSQFGRAGKLAPVGAIAGMGQSFRQDVAAQLDNLGGRHGVAEEQRRGLRQLVRFVENNRVGRRQQFGHAGILQRHIGKEQVMVDYDHVGLLRFLAGLHHETVVVILALAAHAGVAGRCHQIPHQRVFRNAGQFRLIAGRRGLDEARNLAQVSDVLARSQPAVLLRALEVEMAQVIGATLQQRDRDRRIERTAHGRNVAQEKLVLQVLGAGGNDGLAAP